MIRERIDSVEFLRGLAALSVAWFHFTNGSGSDWLPHGFVRSSGEYGWLGVEAFFVISGFIIPYAMQRSGYTIADVGRFLAKRLVRLEPPYLVAVALAIVLWHISAMMPGFRGKPPDISVTQVLLHLGYLNAFFDYPWLNPVFWTLAVEFQYYLLIAFAYPLVVGTWRVPVLLGFACLAFVLPSTAFIFQYAGLFAMGLLTFQRPAFSHFAFAALLVLLAALTILALGPAHAAVGLATTLAIAFWRPAKHAWLAGFGALSYSLYLVHVPVGGRIVNFGSRYAYNGPTRLLVLVTALAASIAAAWLMWKLVERPAQQLSARIRYRRTSESAVAGAGALTIAADHARSDRTAA
jgi:peptidoglycan/LPS O-acetylase OafA/YrhL